MYMDEKMKKIKKGVCTKNKKYTQTNVYTTITRRTRTQTRTRGSVISTYLSKPIEIGF